MSRLFTLFCCTVICASILGAQDVLAQKADIERPLILVASPDMETRTYQESVILVAPHLINGGMGHVGVILNQPTIKSMGNLFPNEESPKKITGPVFFGGPSGLDAVTALVPAKRAPGPGVVLMAPNVYLALNPETISAVIKSAPNDARYYVGLVIWQPRELESELKRGLWFTRETEESIIFSKNSGELWDKLIHPLLQKRDAI